MKLTSVTLAIVALAVLAFYALAFYPGYMSFDSAYHYSQLESGEWTTFQPVIILLFWKVTDFFIEGPGGLFLLFLLVYLISLWLLSRYMQGGYISRVILFLTALLPANIMIFPHIWKDIGLLVFTLLSLVFLLLQLSQQRGVWLLASTCSLWVAMLFRFEAILYLFPLVYFQGQQWLLLREQKTGQSMKLRWAVVFVLLFAVVSISGNRLLVSLSNSHKVTLWPTIALWDIARVSVGEQKQLLPPFTVGANMDVADLTQATKTWTNTSLFSSTKAGVNNGLYTPYQPEQYRTLMKLWVTLPLYYPASYFTHRWALLKDLLRFDESPNKPQDLFWTNQIIKYADRFPVNSSQLNHTVNQQLKQYLGVFFFKPWFYLLIALVILLWRFRLHGLSRQQQLANHLLYCAFFSIGVLFFLAPAAEQRYLIILFNFVPIAACLKLARQDNLQSS